MHGAQADRGVVRSMFSELSDRAVARGLAWAFLGVLALSAYRPASFAEWLLENVLVAILAYGLWLGRGVLRPSRSVSVMTFAFLCLHEIGAHWGYAKVPYESWLHALFGADLRANWGISRNHFDRLAHLMFGLLLTVPIREALMQTSAVRGTWSYVLPVALSMALSCGYEISEGAVVLFSRSDLGTDFIGMQGDIWDAQKDMAFATFGAMAAVSLLKWRNRKVDAEEPSPLTRALARRRRLRPKPLEAGDLAPAMRDEVGFGRG